MMKPCRNTPPRRPFGNGTATDVEPAASAQQNQMNRYSHPIRVKGAARPTGTEELLSYILETLSHQADLLEELLRRTEEKDTV